MKILVYGAGVLCSLYAARLHTAGHEVSILARGERLAQIRRYGIVLEQAPQGTREVVRVPAVEQLAQHDAYHLIIVLVRRDQVDGVLSTLAANLATPTVLFMVNNPSGYAEWAEAVGWR